MHSRCARACRRDSAHPHAALDCSRRFEQPARQQGARAAFKAHGPSVVAAANSSEGAHRNLCMVQGLIPLLMSRITAYFPLDTIYTPVVHETQHPGGRWPSMEGASHSPQAYLSACHEWLRSAAGCQWCLLPCGTFRSQQLEGCWPIVRVCMHHSMTAACRCHHSSEAAACFNAEMQSDGRRLILTSGIDYGPVMHPLIFMKCACH